MYILTQEIKMEKVKMEIKLNEYFLKLHQQNEKVIKEITSYDFFTDYINRFDYKGFGFRRIETLTNEGKNIEIIDLVKLDNNCKYKRFYPILTSEGLINKISEDLNLNYNFFNGADLFELMIISEEFYENTNKVINDIIDEKIIEDDYKYALDNITI